MSDVKEKKDNFLNRIFKKTKNLEDTKKHKVAKVISFAVGACFDLLGVIAVAIWKYLLCTKDENSKYCIRLSIFGMVVKYIICAKLLFSFTLPVFAKKVDTYYSKPSPFRNRKINHKVKPLYILDEEPFFTESFNDDDVFGFSFDFDKELKKMSESFKKQNTIINKIFEKQQKEFDKKVEAQEKNLNIKKDVKIKDGFETTTIEKTGPNVYQKSVDIRYVGNNAEDNSKKKKKSGNNGRFIDNKEAKYNNKNNKRSSSRWHNNKKSENVDAEE